MTVVVFNTLKERTQPISREYFDNRLSAAINEATVSIIKWVAGLLVGQAVLVAALIKLLK